MKRFARLQRKTASLLIGLALDGLAGHAQALHDASSDTSVTVQSIEVTGSKAFSPTTLAVQIADAKGRTLNQGELEQLAERLTAFYYARGRIHVRAILPQQDFANGHVVFRIVLVNAPHLIASSPSPVLPAPDSADLSAATASSKTATQDDSASALLDRARFWIERQRPDLASQELDRLNAVAPDDQRGLTLRAQLHAKAGDQIATRAALARLQAVRPDSPDIARIQTILRLATTDRARMQQARLLARGGHYAQALSLARSLYPDGPPDDDLAREYWQWVEHTPDGWQAAGRGLAELVHNHPDSLANRLAWAIHQTSRAPVDPQALQALAALRHDPQYGSQAKAAWRGAVMHDDVSTRHILQLQEYLHSDPTDQGVRDELATTQKALAARRRELDSPAAVASRAGEQALRDNDLTAAETQFTQSMTLAADNPDALGGLGIVRLRQARYDEAADYFRRARQAQPAARKKWDSLIDTAQFWGQLQNAKQLLATGQASLAEAAVRTALHQQPDQPDALVLLGDALAAQDRHEQAASAWQQALARDPLRHDALTRLAEASRTRGQAAFERFVDGLSPGQREKLGSELNRIRADFLREQANALAADHPGQAIGLLQQAVRLNPDNPWLSFDLARLYAREGQPEKGRTVFLALRARQPDNAESRYAEAIFLDGLDDHRAALATMQGISPADRTPKLDAYQQKLWTAVQIGLARQQAAIHDTEQARAILQQTEVAVAGDRTLTTLVAEEWAHEGDPARARRLFERMASSSPPPDTAWQLKYLQFLADQGDDRALSSGLAGMPPHLADAGDENRLQALRRTFALRMAEAALRDGEPAAAEAAIAPLQAQFPEDPALLLTRARILAENGQNNEAIAICQQLVQSRPEDSDARTLWLDLFYRLQGRDAAAALAGQWFESGQPVSDDARLDLAKWLIGHDRPAAAKRWMDAVLNASPANSRALELKSDIALQSGHYDEAVDALQRSLTARQTSTLAAESPLSAPVTTGNPPASSAQAAIAARSPGSDYDYGRLAAMLDNQIPWLSSAIDWESRAGTPGQSQFTAWQMPVEWQTAWQNGGNWFMRADTVRLQAGVLDCSSSYARQTFGTLLLSPSGCAALADQQAQGTSVTAGFRGQQLTADFGTTPLGFAVWNWVGGVRWKGDLGPASWSLDASRRPDTSTLLSFAGTTDPRTGLVWGGVVATGVRAGLSIDQGGSFGFWSTFGVHRLTGTNVESNQRIRLMAGETWRIINQDDRLLSLGLTAMDWHDNGDTGEFTFGQGGYYSPKNYRSVSLPVTWAARSIRWSYVLRGSVFTSYAEVPASPYFPTNPILQQQAGNPMYSASSGPGSGYSLSEIAEYQVSPGLFVGNQISIERSPYYAPNTFLFYLRYAIDAASARPVALIPAPIQPTSSF